jgi:hypothetical protein
MNAAKISAAFGSRRPQGNGYRCRCPLADEHNRTGR